MAGKIPVAPQQCRGFNVIFIPGPDKSGGPLPTVIKRRQLLKSLFVAAFDLFLGVHVIEEAKGEWAVRLVGDENMERRGANCDGLGFALFSSLSTGSSVRAHSAKPTSSPTAKQQR